MVLFRYFAAVLPAVTAILVLSALTVWPAALAALIVGWLAVAALTFAFLGGQEAKTSNYWQLVLPPALLFLSAVGFELLSEAAAVHLAVAISVSALILCYSWNLYLFLHQPLRYTARTLERLAILSNLSSVFLGGAALFGLRLFLSLPAWKLSLAVLLGGALLFGQSFRSAKLPSRPAFAYLLIFSFLMFQLSVALISLPILYTVSGAVLTLAFYVFLGIGRHLLGGTYAAGIGRRYALITAFCLVLVLGTARWS
ncbi:hypothetical protein EPN90_02920 [Patescibacteria group bacterium]|nr:MAG: hypothetical protein EPN90_02920 [Patescibacteria group bacterium]